MRRVARRPPKLPGRRDLSPISFRSTHHHDTVGIAGRRGGEIESCRIGRRQTHVAVHLLVVSRGLINLNQNIARGEVVIDVELRGAAVANGGLRTTRLVGPCVEFQRSNKTQIVGATIGFGLRRNFGDAGTGFRGRADRGTELQPGHRPGVEHEIDDRLPPTRARRRESPRDLRRQTCLS